MLDLIRISDHPIPFKVYELHLTLKSSIHLFKVMYLPKRSAESNLEEI